MNDIHSDEEQVQALKNWWAENGTSLLLTFAVGMAAWGGWNWWQISEKNKQDQSFADYQALIMQLEQAQQNPSDEVLIAELAFQAQQIKEKYPSGYYGSFAAFLKARQAMLDDDQATAVDELQWVLDQNPPKEIELIATLRLARVHFEIGNNDVALGLLDIDDAGSFTATFAELKGDVLMESRRYQDAHDAYQFAKGSVEEGEASSPLIETKIDYSGSFL